MIEFALAFSMHFGVGSGWNEVHPSVRYVDDNFTIGAFLNSENTLSGFASYTIGDPVFLEMGLVTGYSSAPVLPLVRAGFEINDNVKVFVMPAVVVYQSPKHYDVGFVIGTEITF